MDAPLISGGLSFQEFPFSVASDTWTITHGFGFYPNVEVQVWVDGVLTKTFPNRLEYPDVNTVIIGWTKPQSGYAIVAA